MFCLIPWLDFKVRVMLEEVVFECHCQRVCRASDTEVTKCFWKPTKELKNHIGCQCKSTRQLEKLSWCENYNSPPHKITECSLNLVWRVLHWYIVYLNEGRPLLWRTLCSYSSWFPIIVYLQPRNTACMQITIP